MLRRSRCLCSGGSGGCRCHRSAQAKDGCQSDYQSSQFSSSLFGRAFGASSIATGRDAAQNAARKQMTAGIASHQLQISAYIEQNRTPQPAALSMPMSRRSFRRDLLSRMLTRSPDLVAAAPGPFAWWPGQVTTVLDDHAAIRHRLQPGNIPSVAQKTQRPGAGHGMRCVGGYRSGCPTRRAALRFHCCCPGHLHSFPSAFCCSAPRFGHTRVCVPCSPHAKPFCA